MEAIFSRSREYRILIEDYDFSTLNHNKYFTRGGVPLTEISFQAVDFLFDIVTCGMPQFYLANSISMKRVDEIRYKIFLLRTALKIDDDGYVVVSDNIKYLDASEKKFVSYCIGMFITKLISRVIFDYDYLVHYGIVKSYKKVVKAKTVKGKEDRREPDLIAFYRKKDEYSIFEAKGREKLTKGLITSAKGQINVIKKISGLTPDLGVVSVVHPIKEGCRITCSMYDPETNDKEESEVIKDDLFYVYYYPSYELIKENKKGTSWGEFDLELKECVIKCNVAMNQKIYSYFSEYADMAGMMNVKANNRLGDIVKELQDDENDINFEAEWIIKY